jgi:DNA-directed RNA polymerase subunit RPC12/RpoP
MKRQGATKSRINNAKPNDDKVVISSDYYKEERLSYICSICNRTLSRLSDAGGNNSTYWCRNCSVEFDPELENVRRESKITVPDRNQETLVATTPGQDYLNKKVEIKHTPEIKGAFKSLQQKGIRIKEYHTTEKE